MFRISRSINLVIYWVTQIILLSWILLSLMIISLYNRFFFFTYNRDWLIDFRQTASNYTWHRNFDFIFNLTILTNLMLVFATYGKRLIDLQSKSVACFYMRAALAFNGLIDYYCQHHVILVISFASIVLTQTESINSNNFFEWHFLEKLVHVEVFQYFQFIWWGESLKHIRDSF